MAKSIVLIGFMGVGKTTVGKALASKLKLNFYDMDDEIEKVYGLTIPQVFEKFGEDHFRTTEEEVTCEFCSRENIIISPGGGAFIQEDIRTYCLKHNRVIFLDMSWDAWCQRRNILLAGRPKLQKKSLDEIKELYDMRREIYSLAHERILVDGKTVEKIAGEIDSF